MEYSDKNVNIGSKVGLNLRALQRVVLSSDLIVLVVAEYMKKCNVHTILIGGIARAGTSSAILPNIVIRDTFK
ncbi:hypothetical protein NE686_17240 [Tissierella carlieri]|uniref:Uncharacterized protein n=1 Tax=Tissierella carlieri TaxID=689904 RepID=A0ABT1SEG0_9FIRM|nr:hypothetical protein [Tissierella carlieri]MCQ4924850.1 hypothetical protein [Tissierella carlieri]